LVQIGAADDSISVSPAEGNGVGDDAHSWAFDGARSCVWHGGKERAYGPGAGHWAAGDIVGVYVLVESAAVPAAGPGSGKKKRARGKSEPAAAALPRKQLSIGFSLNGEYLGDAFMAQSSSSRESPSQYFYPVVSVESGESAQINIGQRPFQFYRDGTMLGESVKSSDAIPAFLPVLNSLDADITSSIGDYMAFYYSNLEKSNAQSSSSGGASGGPEKRIGKGCAAAGVSKEGSIAPPAKDEQISYDIIDIDSPEFSSSAESFHRFGIAHLKAELERRGLKSGGTLAERAGRLFAVRGITAEKIDKKYKAKTAPAREGSK
jgi:hypothetical protein